MLVNLTPKQARVLTRLRDYIERTGTAPTLDELAGRCRVSKSTIRQYLSALEEKGYIRRSRYAHRSIELIGEGARGRLPVVGRVAAGNPILAVENIEDHIDGGDLLADADFALHVRGDSMTGAGINDGDLVLAKAQPTVESGEIAVVVIGDEATVKRVRLTRKSIILEPANGRYKPMTFDRNSEELRIAGKVLMALRTF